MTTPKKSTHQDEAKNIQQTETAANPDNTDAKANVDDDALFACIKDE
ncbi:MAG: hypothetical protein Q4C56_00515 [Peptococcaceae bacterium]|nr:hypothetical protein [Peptococcaceae bacterium]